MIQQALLWAAAGTGFTFLMTTIGAAMVFFMKRQSSALMQQIFLGFASGVMIAASIWSLLIPAIDAAAQNGQPGWIPAAGGFILGLVLMLTLDGLMLHLHSGAEQAEGLPSSFRRTTLLVLAVTLHNIPEGMAVGLAFALAGVQGGLAAAAVLALGIGGLMYITAFSLVYLKKAYDHCLELGITRKELSNVIKSSLIFSVVPSLSIVVGLFVLIAVLGSVWAWWRLSVIGSLSYETMISSSIAQVLGYASSAEMLESATGRQFGVVMILMSVGMLSGFLILLPFGKKLCKSVDRSAAESGGSTWKNVLSGVFMLVMFSVYIPILLFTDNVQAAVMITGLVIAIGVGVLAKRPGLAWLNNFVMAFSMLGGLISSLAWVRIFG